MKKTKIIIVLVVLTIVSIIGTTVNAATILNYESLTYGDAIYKILVDGQSYTIPQTVTYDDGYTLDLTKFKERVSQMSINALTYRNNGEITYNGGLYNAIIDGEYIVFFKDNAAINNNLTDQIVKNGFERFQLLPDRIKRKETYEARIENENPQGDILDQYNFRISTYAEDIAIFEQIEADTSKKPVLATLPYLGLATKTTETLNFDEQRITMKIELGYYPYAIICRDLRLDSITYSINGQAYTAVPSFNKDTYTYTIKLPDNTPSNATITTKSEGYMQKLIDQNSSLKDIDSGLVITEANTSLSNGMATVRVTNTFDVTGTYGSMIDKTLSSNPNRTYTIKFTKFNFLKGDIDRNGVVDANDASLALEKYKINEWSQDDLKYGDMDENNLIDANDASLILEVYKTNN